MGLYELSNYLLVCERDPFTGFGGCGTELRLEQERSAQAAAAVATERGWLANPPGVWDKEQGQYDWFVLCPYCNNQRKARLAQFDAKKAAAAAAGLGQP